MFNPFSGLVSLGKSLYNTGANALGGIADSMDRSKQAEERYGGVDQGNTLVPGAGNRQRQLLGYADYAAGRASPGVSRSAATNQQYALANQLMNQAQGRGPSLAQMQLQQAADRNMMQQAALARSGPPQNLAAAQRLAMQNQSQIGAGLGAQSAMARLQEQGQAQGMLGNVLGQARGQDLQASLGAGDMALRGRAINDQAALEAYRQELQQALAQQQGGLGYEQLRAQRYGSLVGQPTVGESVIGALGGVLGFGGSR